MAWTIVHIYASGTGDGGTWTVTYHPIFDGPLSEDVLFNPNCKIVEQEHDDLVVDPRII